MHGLVKCKKLETQKLESPFFGHKKAKKLSIRKNIPFYSNKLGG